MKIIILSLALFPLLAFGQAKPSVSWIGKPNRLLNPGAEANSEGAPLNWKSDYTTGSESNWVSAYGATSHEWNHGDKKLGLPANPGNNYFRLTVDRHNENRKLNLFQVVHMDDVRAALIADTVLAEFQVWIGSGHTTQTNCAFAEVKVLFQDSSGSVVDSMYVKKTPGAFRDLDAGTPDAEARGFNVMHEMQRSNILRQVPRGTRQAIVMVYCEYPCDKFNADDEEESQGARANTFFFDNFSLGFFRN